MPKEKKKALWVDEETHTEVAVNAARNKMSIKQYLKKLFSNDQVITPPGFAKDGEVGEKINTE